MSRKILNILFIFSLICLSGISLRAQDGADNSYSPYSVFGVGDIIKQGTAYNQSMGGVGIATRNKRFISYVNPASITAKDTLSFMLDFSLCSDNRIYQQGDIKSAKNAFNISNIAFSVPIYRKSAFVMGLTPYSSVGYDFSHNVTDPAIIASTGKINYAANGNGGLYSLFAGPAATFWNKFSIGIQGIYYFGNIDKVSSMNFERTGYRNFSSGYILELSAFTGKIGVQYEQNIGNDMSLVFGATYTPKAKLKGYVTDYKYSTMTAISENRRVISKRDTLRYEETTLSKSSPKLASEFGFGVAFKKGDKFNIELNYLRSDWGKSSFDKTVGFANRSNPAFSPTVSQSLRAGMEYVPNRNDIRYYFRRCSYRAGAYYDNAYYKLDGNMVNSYGITLGITLPVFRFYNGLSIGVDVGQRGSSRNLMTKETYAKFVIGFNISDIWFVKPKYN